MQKPNHKELSSWLSINNHPSLYMHKQWWEKLDIEHLLLLLQSNTHPPLHIKIDKHIINIMELSAISQHNSANSQEHKFWLNHFFVLKQVALTLGLLLQRNPVMTFMSGEIYRHIEKILPIKKIRAVIINSHFIAGQVVAFSQEYFNKEEKAISVSTIEGMGKILLVSAAFSGLENRINLLFPPEPTKNTPTKINLDYKQRIQVQYLIKRLVRLIGLSNSTL